MKHQGLNWRRVGRVILGAAAALTLTVGLAACTPEASGPEGGASAEGTGTLDGQGASIVVFMPSTANIYMSDWADAVRAQAKDLGYEVKIFENKTDQTEQDQQVQRFLATGEVPAAFIWWPANAEAGINSSRLLSRVAPVVQGNQPVLDAGQEYITAYVGADAEAVGRATGQAAMEARQDILDNGGSLRGDGGSLLAFTWPAGYASGIVRHDAFIDETASEPFTILQVEPTISGFDAQSAFEVAAPVIPKFLSQGIDIVTSQNLSMAGGVITALEQNGLIPGKDVIVIAGADSGAKAPLLDGKVYSAIVNSGVIEGSLAVQVVAKLVAAGGVTDEVVSLEATPEAPELTTDAPARVTYMPTPQIRASEVDAFRLWGFTYQQLGTQ